jgi:hypothetical protein
MSGTGFFHCLAVLILALGFPAVAFGQSQLGSCPTDTSVLWTKCQGTRTYSNGDKYVGEFRDGQFNGQGTGIYASGNTYVGEFRAGSPNGWGTYSFSNGDTYIGEVRPAYVDGVISAPANGKGTYTYANGARYIGEFRDGVPNGRGAYYLVNGSIWESGLWENNQFVGPVTAAANGPAHKDTSHGHAEIALVGDGGTFKVPVVINGSLTLNFTIDSGAADVSIPADVVLTLMRTGTLAGSDFLGTQTDVLADGSTMPSETFRIRTLKVGNRVIRAGCD